jgi:hypothetical protein
VICNLTIYLAHKIDRSPDRQRFKRKKRRDANKKIINISWNFYFIIISCFFFSWDIDTPKLMRSRFFWLIVLFFLF